MLIPPYGLELRSASSLTAVLIAKLNQEINVENNANVVYDHPIINLSHKFPDLTDNEHNIYNGYNMYNSDINIIFHENQRESDQRMTGIFCTLSSRSAPCTSNLTKIFSVGG